MAISIARTIVLDAPTDLDDGFPPARPVPSWPCGNWFDNLAYAIDWTAWLNDVGDTISDATVSWRPWGDLEINVNSPLVTGNVLSFRVGPQLSGRDYLFLCTISTVHGRVFKQLCQLSINQTLEEWPLPPPQNAGFSNPVAAVASELLGADDAMLTGGDGAFITF
jgi:hypothetical protein